MTTAHQITTTEAREAARRFVRYVKTLDHWDLRHADGCLPQGYVLDGTATDDAFMPLTIERATQAFRLYAVRA